MPERCLPLGGRQRPRKQPRPPSGLLLAQRSRLRLGQRKYHARTTEVPVPSSERVVTRRMAQTPPGRNRRSWREVPMPPAMGRVSESIFCFPEACVSSPGIDPGKCASSEGWHEQWVKVPPG